MKRTRNVEEVEQKVLSTFKKENPSIHFSDKSKQEYRDWAQKRVYLFRDLLHFPPKMFDGCSLIDFGAGTGENTVQFANWGAECTLVDVNDEACIIARGVFDKYAEDPEKHKIICSSVFKFAEDTKKDIVVTNGMIHHTDDNEGAFKKIASYVSPDGYLILGLSNKSGGFQNMLQRMIIFEFTDDENEIIELAKQLFEEDLYRAQTFSKRTINSIIYLITTMAKH